MKKQPDRFVQGFACAVAMLLEKHGMAETSTRELFHEGIGKYDLKMFRKEGIDEYDISIFKKYRKQLI